MRKDIITDHAKISWILDQCQILHLGLSNKNGSYIVPVHYVYQEDTDVNILFIFMAQETVKKPLL